MENQSPADLIANLKARRKTISQEISKVVVGQEEARDLMLIAILCGGHALLFGVPGVGKTLMASTLAKVLKLDFRRIQFTPDLMPADITGSEIIEEDPTTQRQTRRFMGGPIFTNFLLADEINRTPPRTQAALLQAMQEGTVSSGRQTYQLQPPFFVLATQNPIEMEGTYPLPEAQLDRFLFRIDITYPTPEEEARVVKGTTSAAQEEPQFVLGPGQIIELQQAVRNVQVADDIVDYAVRITGSTRPGYDAGIPALADVITYLEVGASPRASQTLILTAKAKALLDDRVHVNFDDVKTLAPHVLKHRLIPNFRARADGITVEQLIDTILEAIPQEGS